MTQSTNINAFLDSGKGRYSFNALADVATVEIYGEINDWWGFGVREMALNLAENKSKELQINIHSPGGSALEGVGVANLIKNHQGRTTTTGIGLVASIASIVLLAADEVQMAENSFLMIHNPWSFAVGGSEELRKTANVLDKMTNELALIYQSEMESRGNEISIDEVKVLMENETWYTAIEAKEAGLIDSVVGSVEFSESSEEINVLNNYNNVPQALLKQFSIKKENKMSEKNKSLFARLGEIFMSAADEEVTTTDENTDETTDDNTDTTMTDEEMKKALEENGYTVAVAVAEKEEDEKEEDPQELQIAAMKKQLEELQNTLKQQVGTPSGGADGEAAKNKKDRIPQAAKNYFDNLAKVIKTHRPN